MPYFPGIPPSLLEQLRQYLSEELNRINSDVVTEQNYFSFEILTAEPPKPTIGQISYASGYIGAAGSPLGSPIGSPAFGWDPGAGEGLYEFTNIGWAKLGGGNGNFVPTSHAALNNLGSDDHTQYHNDTRGDARYYSQAIIDARVLSSLADCVITTPTEGEVLKYNATSGDWENAVAPDSNFDGGFPDAIYLSSQNIDGGTP